MAGAAVPLSFCMETLSASNVQQHGATMVHDVEVGRRVEEIVRYLEEIMEEGERWSRNKALPLVSRVYWAGRAIAAGQVLARLLNDARIGYWVEEIREHASSMIGKLIKLEERARVRK